MRGAGRVNHQTAAIAHIGQVAEDFECFDEFFALLATAPDVKAEDRTRAPWQQLLRQRAPLLQNY